jgi:hypothetical protein
VRLDAELALIHLRNESGHELAITNRPRRGSTHRLVHDLFHGRAVEVRTVHDQLDRVDDRLTRDGADERE